MARLTQHFGRWYPFIHLGGERHHGVPMNCKVSCPRTQNNISGLGSNPDSSIQSLRLANHEATMSHTKSRLHDSEKFGTRIENKRDANRLSVDNNGRTCQRKKSTCKSSSYKSSPNTIFHSISVPEIAKEYSTLRLCQSIPALHDSLSSLCIT